MQLASAKASRAVEHPRIAQTWDGAGVRDQRVDRAVLDAEAEACRVRGRMSIAVDVLRRRGAAAGRAVGVEPIARFDRAEEPERAKVMFEMFVKELGATGIPVKTGRFREHMIVSLENDGPVTFIL